MLLTAVLTLQSTPPNLEQRFAREPQNQTAIVGSRVTLPCRVINKSGVLQWTKDGFGLGAHRNLTGFDRYRMIGSDEEGESFLSLSPPPPPTEISAPENSTLLYIFRINGPVRRTSAAPLSQFAATDTISSVFTHGGSAGRNGSHTGATLPVTEIFPQTFGIIYRFGISLSRHNQIRFGLLYLTFPDIPRKGPSFPTCGISLTRFSQITDFVGFYCCR
ncbi:UNVERIFIED_CONTAM: hypothetical protein PYX00_006089 [Menopon gallinae]|uniref:Ig-like domain-containing protein n=1 Tax=Menopon gallinae TaxID=328185 RepID=A0AAW2HTS5_9NEOP